VLVAIKQKYEMNQDWNKLLEFETRDLVKRFIKKWQIELEE
jgi:hypothetical protein